MDEIVEFVGKFLKAEFKARMVMLTEADNEKRRKAYNAALAFCDGKEMDSVVQWTNKPDRERVEISVERPLFVVREFQKGKLYEAIVGNEFTPDFGSTFRWALFITPAKGKPKITAIYWICGTCYGLGKHKGKQCPECKGSTINTYVGGGDMPLQKFGAATAVKKLLPPEDDKSLEAYNSY